MLRCYIAMRRAKLLTFLLVVSHAADPKPFNLPGVEQDIEFAKTAEVSQTLDAYVPEDEGPFPRCILVRGGGFTKVDKHALITRPF